MVIVALFLATGIASAECRQLDLYDLDIAGLRSDVYIEKRGPRIARRVPLEPFCVDVLREYVSARCCLHARLVTCRGNSNEQIDERRHIRKVRQKRARYDQRYSGRYEPPPSSKHVWAPAYRNGMHQRARQ